MYSKQEDIEKHAKQELIEFQIQTEQAVMKLAAELAPPPVASAVEINEEKVEVIQAAFKAMDIDSSGSIDIEELYEVLQLVHGSDKEVWTKDKVKRVFGMVDADGDQIINEAEFTAFVQQITSGMSDEDFNTRIAGYQVMGKQASMERARMANKERLNEAKKVFQAMDVDHNGKLSVEEFFALGQVIYAGAPSWTVDKCRKIVAEIVPGEEVFSEPQFTSYLLRVCKGMDDQQFTAMLGRYK